MVENFDSETVRLTNKKVAVKNTIKFSNSETNCKACNKKGSWSKYNYLVQFSESLKHTQIIKIKTFRVMAKF